MNKSPLLLLILILTASGCTSRPQDSLRPAQLARNLPSLLERPLADRLVPIPAILLADLKAEDKRDDYRPHPMTDTDQALLVACIENLPASLRSPLDAGVRGISFVEGFLGGGMTWDLYDDHGSSGGFWLVFNSRLLTETTSQWLTYRDNTALEEGLREVLSETAVPEVPALMFLLVHEAAHVFDFAHGVTPVARAILAHRPVTPVAGDFGFAQKYPLNDAWHFYHLSAAPRVSRGTLDSSWEALKTSNFASFYGSQSALEDWAELVTYGVLQRDLGVEITLVWGSREGPERVRCPTKNPVVQGRIRDTLRRLVEH